MKLHDFGLWFRTTDCYRIDDWPEWSTTIPETGGFYIYYDGKLLGCQYPNFDLVVNRSHPHILKLKGWCMIGRCLTLDDFEIIPNPDYE